MVYKWENKNEKENVFQVSQHWGLGEAVGEAGKNPKHPELDVWERFKTAKPQIGKVRDTSGKNKLQLSSTPKTYSTTVHHWPTTHVDGAARIARRERELWLGIAHRKQYIFPNRERSTQWKRRSLRRGKSERRRWSKKMSRACGLRPRISTNVSYLSFLNRNMCTEVTFNIWKYPILAP